MVREELRHFTDEEILGKLALGCYRAGGMRKWAQKNGCSYSSISRILSGKQPISLGIAKILKIEPRNIWIIDDEEDETLAE